MSLCKEHAFHSQSPNSVGLKPRIRRFLGVSTREVSLLCQEMEAISWLASEKVVEAESLGINPWE